MPKSILTFVLLCLLYFTAQGQDPIYSQFYAAPIQLNPAFAGNTVGPHISINYRNQWPSLQGSYVTYSAAYSQYFPTVNTGFGLMVLSDDAGEGLLKTNKASAVFSYRLQVNRDFFLKFGAEGGVVQSRLDWDRLIFLDQIDAEIGPISPGGTPFPTEEVRPDNLNNTYVDISAGLLAYSSNFYGGVTIKHLNTPSESFLGINENLDEGLPMRLTLHGGAEIPLSFGNNWNTNSFISPSVMFVKQGDFGQLNAGSLIKMGYIYGGVWYRHTLTNGDAVIFVAGVQQGAFKIGYSYDMTISGLGLNRSGGSHEFSLIINLERPNEVDYNDCLNLFR
ncbi:MAG: type IX secretion system membrane protein PorP/SprF [Bacteroidota bacterium]